MAITFDKKQIVSTTELISSFGEYLERDLYDHDIFIFNRNTPEAVLVTYERYEQMKNQLEELRDLLEHVAIYGIVEQRKTSLEKKISLEELKKEYGL
ncbi:MAG: type II toxin-antitoxin system prevent-host-death family antitoxin [bacterium]|nr:type II toxin-antitoxin system prevent-host-death family antitoxin [bacterium]